MIVKDIQFDKELDTVNGVYYNINGDLVIDENRVIIDEESVDYHYPHKCVNNSQDCFRCTVNTDFTVERIRLSPLTSKKHYILERECMHQLGAVFNSWTVTPSK